MDSKGSSLLSVLIRNPADVAFGLLSVPMGLAAAKVASPVAQLAFLPFVNSILLSMALFLQFSAAMVVSVHVFSTTSKEENANLNQEQFLSLLSAIGFMGLFALLLIVISVLPSPISGQFGPTHAVMLFYVFSLVISILMFRRILPEHETMFIVLMFVLIVIIITSAILLPKDPSLSAVLLITLN